MEAQEATTEATTAKVPLKEAISNLKESAEGILETYYDLATATLTKKSADATAFIVTRVVMACLVMLALTFAFFGLAFWIGGLINSVAGGFMIVAGFFALVLVIAISMKAKVIDPFIRNAIVKKIYQKRNDANLNDLR